jgi:hypothetical protein
MIRNQFMIAFLLGASGLMAQEPGRVIIEGEARDTLDRPVPFVTIRVSGRPEGCAGDRYGKFKLPVFPGDMLMFSAVSFKTDSIRIPDTLTADWYRLRVILAADTVMLSEVVIRPYPKTWEEVSSELLDLDEPEYTVKTLTKQYLGEDLSNIPNSFFSFAGITTLYTIIGKRPREERELRAVIVREQMQERILERYNPEVVSRLTGLKDEASIVRLMVFCDLEVPFILNASNYDLYEAIMQCYHSSQLFR